MLFLIIALATCADEPVAKPENIPKDVRGYFERCDSVYEENKKRLADSIEQLEVDLNGARSSQRVRLSRKLKELKDEQRELKPTKVRAWMPRKPEEGDIGHLEHERVLKILDTKGMITTWYADHKVILVKGWDTSRFSYRSRIPVEEFFRVTSTNADPERIKFAAPKGERVSGIEVERIPAGDIMKWRVQYDKEKAVQ